MYNALYRAMAPQLTRAAGHHYNAVLTFILVKPLAIDTTSIDKIIDTSRCAKLSPRRDGRLFLFSNFYTREKSSNFKIKT